MEDLRLAIIVLGVFSILGILIHGLWTIRKNATAKESDNTGQTESPSFDEPPSLHDDPLATDSNNDTLMSMHSEGVNGTRNGDPLEGTEPNINLADTHLGTGLDTDPYAPDINLDLPREPSLRVDELRSGQFDTDGIGQVRVVKETEKKRPYSIKKEAKRDSAEPMPEPETPFPEPPSSLLKNQRPEDSQLDKHSDSVVAVKTTRLEPRHKTSSTTKTKEKVSLTERARQFVAGTDKTERPTTKRVEPKLNEEQIRMDFEPDEPRARVSHQSPSAQAPSSPQTEPVEQEVLVLNVKMPEGKQIAGASLLPALLTLGFKFGEQDVFHRHANSNGKGPKLFSLANMFKPGTFDLDSMETFQTQGISLFMILPIEGDPQQVFNMMHNAARKLADEFGAQILDARRSLLTKQSLQQYVEKIREFERKRMINRT